MPTAWTGTRLRATLLVVRTCWRIHTWRLLLTTSALLTTTCGRPRDDEPGSSRTTGAGAPTTRDAAAPSADGARVPGLDAAATAPPPRPRPCSDGARVVRVLERRSDHVAVCFNDVPECWRASLDASAPRIDPLAGPDWPAALGGARAPSAPAPTGPTWVTDPPPEGPDEVELPAGWTTRVLAPTSATPRDRDDEPPPIGAIELCRPGGCAQLTLAPLRPQQAGLAGHVQGVHVAGDGARVAITRGSPRAGRTVAELYELPSGRRIAVLSSRARALSPVSAGGQCTRPARWLGPGLLVQESDCEWPGDYFLHDTDGRRLSTLPFAGDDATPATWHDLGDGRWVLSSGGVLTGFDTRSGRRLPTRDLRPDHPGEGAMGARVVALQPGGDLLVAWGDGELSWIDARLRQRARAAPPRCP